MSDLILYTSGTTDEPKEVCHTSDAVKLMLKRSINELELTKRDVVINVFSSNVIAYYAITGLTAIEAGATLINMNFEPYQFIKAFKRYKPTVIGLIPRMMEVLQHTKGFQELDMSCVRYMIMGSQNVSQEMIDLMRSKGVQTVGNWYGSTENPPPVFVAKNNTVFDFKPRIGYTVQFASDGECIVNGVPTGDIFDTEKQVYLKRKNEVSNRSTWKTNL